MPRMRLPAGNPQRAPTLPHTATLGNSFAPTFGFAICVGLEPERRLSIPPRSEIKSITTPTVFDDRRLTPVAQSRLLPFNPLIPRSDGREANRSLIASFASLAQCTVKLA
jgi:hypothetical protein